MVAVNQAAEACHAVDATDAPASTGLFQSVADHLLAGTLDLSAADRTPLGKPLGVFQMLGLTAQVGLAG